MSPMHVEFVGLPGSGKTTVARKLSSSYVPRAYQLRIGYKIAVCRSVLIRQLDGLGRYLPVEAVEMLSRLSKKTNPRRHRKRHGEFLELADQLVAEYTDNTGRQGIVGKWIHDLVVHHNTATDCLSAEEVLLCDEGFLQRGIATFCPPDPVSDFKSDDAQCYLSKIPDPDLVVVLDVPADVAAARIHGRREGPPESFENSLTARFERIEQVIQVMVTRFDDTDVEYLRFTNNGELDDACEVVANEIM